MMKYFSREHLLAVQTKYRSFCLQIRTSEIEQLILQLNIGSIKSKPLAYYEEIKS